MTKRTPRTKDVLRYARNLLVDKGWCQKRFKFVSYDNTESYCSIGAINQAYMDLDASSRVRTTAIDKLNKIIKDETIFSWNDDENRIKEDVITLFDIALNSF